MGRPYRNTLGETFAGDTWGVPTGGGWGPPPSPPTPRPNWAGLVLREGVEQANVQLADIRVQVEAAHIISLDGWYTDHTVTVRASLPLMNLPV